MALFQFFLKSVLRSVLAPGRSLSGGLIFIYSCSALLISFQIHCFKVCEHEYMNISPPPPPINDLPRCPICNVLKF